MCWGVGRRIPAWGRSWDRMTACLPPSLKLHDAVLEAWLQRPPWGLFMSQGSTHLLTCQCCLYCTSHLGYEIRSLGDSERAWELHCLLSLYKVHSVSQMASQVLVVKSLPANRGDFRDVGWIPGSERSPREGHGNPLQYSFLENPMEELGGLWSLVSQRVRPYSSD